MKKFYLILSAILIAATASFAVPTVLSVSSPTSDVGVKTLGDKIEIIIAFSEAVNVSSDVILDLNSGTTNAIYKSGTGTANIVFEYTVGAGDYSADLDYSATNSLSGGTIVATVGGATATRTLATPGAVNSLSDNQTFSVDAQKPTVLSVEKATTPGTAVTIINGGTVDITVTFSENITITGSPRLLLETGSVDHYATYISFSGAKATFRYAVVNGDYSADLNYKGTSSLELNGATIADLNGNTATLTLPFGGTDLAATSAITVDGVIPVVTNITSTKADGTYRYIEGNTVNNTVEIIVTFSEAVNVDITVPLDLPKLTMATGGDLATAVYSSSSPDNKNLKFNYIIQSTDNISDLDYLDAIDTDAGAPEVWQYALTDGTSIKDVNLNNVAEANGTIKIPAPGAMGSLGRNKAIAIDNTAPTQPAVISTSAPKTYIIGNIVYITATFNEVVNVTGFPSILLETGTGTDQNAVYLSGSGSKILTFKYTVVAGDVAPSLDYQIGSIVLNSGGTINDKAGNAAILTLPAPVGDGILNSTDLIVIDGVTSAVSSISGTAPVAPAYKAGQTVPIHVIFVNGAVTVTGVPKILLETGTVDRYATYVSGSPGSDLLFNYLVVVGDETAVLNVKSATALTGTIKDASGNNATLTLPTSGSSSLANSLIKIDAITPVVTNINSNTVNGTYKYDGLTPANNDILITVTFNDVVYINGATTTLELAAGVSGPAAYISGDATNTLTFKYIIPSGTGDNIADLDYLAAVKTSIDPAPLVYEYALTDAGILIADVNGNKVAEANGTIKIPAPGTKGSLGYNKAIVIDNTAPTIPTVTCTMVDDVYSIGDIIYFTLNFNEAVYVTTGTSKPKILMNTTGGTDHYAYYYSGTGTKTLKFKYTVLVNDVQIDLNYVDGSLTANTGTIKDKAGNEITYATALPAINGNGINGSAGNFTIDGVKPTVNGITSILTYDPAVNSVGNTDDVITFTVNFSKEVNVTGTPKILLETGNIDRYATYRTAGGSGTTDLLFDYKVLAGDATANLTVKSATALGSGTIKDLYGNVAILTIPTASSSIRVDAIVPTVLKVTSTNANGYYKTGNINVRVQFSENLTSANTLQLKLGAGIGTPDLLIGVVNVLTPNLVDFTYAVASGDENIDLNYANTGALTGAIADLNGNVATLTLPALTSSNSLGGNKNLYVDAKAPVITDVTTPNAGGTYYIGNIIYIKINYAEKVKITGKPTLALNNGATANYYSGSNSTALQFKYTVAAGQASVTDLDVTSIGLTGATITDLAGNTAIATLNGTGLLDKGITIVNSTSKSAQLSITDIEDNSNDAEFGINVYPNPVTNGKIELYLTGTSENKEVEIQIHNILGDNVYTLKSQVTEKIVIEKKLEAGVYIISVVNNGQVFNQNIIVQ